MVTYVRDQTGRFQQRPHYKPEELDRECESVITGFLKGLYGEARYPVDTEDLKKLIERDAEDLDVYADLSIYGPDVEGKTFALRDNNLGSLFDRSRSTLKDAESLPLNYSRHSQLTGAAQFLEMPEAVYRRDDRRLLPLGIDSRR